MIKHIELPRMTDGLLAPPGGSAKKSGKRLREGGAVSSPNFSPKVEQSRIVEQLASMDITLLPLPLPLPLPIPIPIPLPLPLPRSAARANDGAPAPGSGRGGTTAPS